MLAKRRGINPQALEYYSNVFYETNLRDGETASPFHVYEAGLAAIALLEERGRWKEATRLYDRMMREFPMLVERLNRQSERARLHVKKGEL